MRYGLYVPNVGESSDARMLAELARDAERTGWDGFFLFDTIMFRRGLRTPIVDAFTALAAVAMTTSRIRIGTTVTPLARRRPWKVARETVSLDHLSGGRLVLGVGLGDPPDADFAAFGEESDARVRAEKLDEGLEILGGLWGGEEFTFRGRHYNVEKALFLPRPRQAPRIPIWVGGFWPHRPPFRRAARWDGVIPLRQAETSAQWRLEPDDLQRVLAYISRRRTTSGSFDAVVIGFGQLDDAARPEKMKAYGAAGATWWLENLAPYSDAPEAMRARILKGPLQG